MNPSPLAQADAVRAHATSRIEDRRSYRVVSRWLNGGALHPPRDDGRHGPDDGEPKTAAPELRRARVVVKPMRPTDRARVAWYPILRKLFRQAANEGLVENIIVHGSFGDLSHVPYSDLDLTVVLGEGLVQSPDGLVRLREWVRVRLFPFLLTVDPLQHHGAFFLWPSLMRHYPEDVLPVRAYRSAWAVREASLAFGTFLPDVSSLEELPVIATCDRLRAPERTFFRTGYHLYGIKDYLSNIMLVPALYSLSIGKPTTKKRSFAPFYRAFGARADAVRAASEVRRRWPRVSGFPAWLTPRLWRYPVGRRLVRGLRRHYRDAGVSREVRRRVLPGVPALCRAVEAAIEENRPDLVRSR